MERLVRVGLIAVLAAALCACSKGGTSGGASSDTAAAASGAASSAPAATQAVASASDGAGLYATNCSSCHQSNGAGSPGAFPPLDGNPAVTGDPVKVMHIVKYGLSGKIAVNGQNYNGTMPNWGQNLTNDQIASVVTYIRSAWTNKAGAVSSAQVAAVTK